MHNGNYNGIPTAENTISIVDAIRKAVPEAEVIYDKACELVDRYLTTDHMPDINEGKGLFAEFFKTIKNLKELLPIPVIRRSTCGLSEITALPRM